SNDPGVYARHAIDAPSGLAAEFRINPLYRVTVEGEQFHLKLQFPNDDYEDEYGAAKRYLPDEARISTNALNILQAGERSPALLDLLKRKVIVELPRQYY